MSAAGKTEFDWGDGRHAFRLRIGELLELQELCDAGPVEIRDRLLTGRWRVNDLLHTIRLGLVGGGMKPAAAIALTRRYAEDRPLQESVMPALTVITAAIIGVPEDQPKAKGDAAPGKKQRGGKGPASSPPAASTAPAPSSAIRRKRSTA